MAEKKFAKFDANTFIIRKENGDKIVIRGSSVENGQAVALKEQVIEFRRDEGSVLAVVRDMPPRWADFNAEGIRRHVEHRNLAAMSNDDIAADIIGLFGITS